MAPREYKFNIFWVSKSVRRLIGDNKAPAQDEAVSLWRESHPEHREAKLEAERVNITSKTFRRSSSRRGIRPFHPAELTPVLGVPDWPAIKKPAAPEPEKAKDGQLNLF